MKIGIGESQVHVPSIPRGRSDQRRYVPDEQKSDSCNRLKRSADSTFKVATNPSFPLVSLLRSPLDVCFVERFVHGIAQPGWIEAGSR